MEREKKERAEKRAKKEAEAQEKIRAKQAKEDERKAKKKALKEAGNVVSSDTDDYREAALAEQEASDSRQPTAGGDDKWFSWF